MSGNHRVKGSGFDPRDSRFLTDRTERLPYAMMLGPQLSKLQKVTHVLIIIFLSVLLINLIAIDVGIVLLYLRFPEIVVFFNNLRG